jgi:hypothetical protein
MSYAYRSDPPEKELRNVAREFAALKQVLQLQILYAEPRNQIDPNLVYLVYADGTVWNPGAGAGLYLKVGTGSWVKIS